MDPNFLLLNLMKFCRVVQAFKANFIKKGMSEYEKVLTAYQYLRYTCGYAWGGWQYNGANTAWGALVYGEAQCSGFARAMKALATVLASAAIMYMPTPVPRIRAISGMRFVWMENGTLWIRREATSC